ncbi:hypothetical protein NPIL_520621 [Nephila pilipes]|uniref:Uncharacterized protein n=1 Tax=Nephila pilipes TaxID=299642 RepID=A0A8X6QJB6_NEPPI|nr:hypothetical protein NPIL_520621 [Nephila pilipes]
MDSLSVFQPDEQNIFITKGCTMYQICRDLNFPDSVGGEGVCLCRSAEVQMMSPTNHGQEEGKSDISILHNKKSFFFLMPLNRTFHILPALRYGGFASLQATG